MAIKGLAPLGVFDIIFHTLRRSVSFVVIPTIILLPTSISLLTLYTLSLSVCYSRHCARPHCILPPVLLPYNYCKHPSNLQQFQPATSYNHSSNLQPSKPDVSYNHSSSLQPSKQSTTIQSC